MEVETPIRGAGTKREYRGRGILALVLLAATGSVGRWSAPAVRGGGHLIGAIEAADGRWCQDRGRGRHRRWGRRDRRHLNRRRLRWRGRGITRRARVRRRGRRR